MRVFWLGRAEDDLEQIGNYIAERDPETALRLLATIRERVALLAAQPGLGRAGRVRDTRELVIARTPYIVAYTVNSPLDGVIGLRVLHSARRWPEEL